MDVLVVTAVEAERDAVLSATPTADVLVGGVGPVEAAATTSAALAAGRYNLVLCAGIGGGFAPLAVGDVAVASSIVFADLGAETSDGFVSVDALGVGCGEYAVAPKLAVQLADRTGGRLGTILTVATVTGTAQTADALTGRHPDAVAEGMEGAGVAAAARRHGTAYAEVRAVSNAVGPRDRDAWRIPDALRALGAAVASILSDDTQSDDTQSDDTQSDDTQSDDPEGRA